MSDIAAKTVFVMLYAGAVEGADVWLRPDQVTRMTDAQSGQHSEEQRSDWRKESMRRSRGEIPGRWYAVNTRESIRDDTIRNALIPNSAVVERAGLATTSPSPRYALQRAFAALLAPELTGERLDKAIATWQRSNLSSTAWARQQLIQRGAVAGGEYTLVTYPNGETRRLAKGPSSIISKAVVEKFSPMFLHSPAVVFLSESREKVVSRDDELAKRIGLNIDAQQILPDLVLFDAGDPALLVFIEVVATDGPITTERQRALADLAAAVGLPADQVKYVTAYRDRSDQAFRRTLDSLAWGSFVWFASEPDNLIYLYRGEQQAVTKLVDWP